MMPDGPTPERASRKQNDWRFPVVLHTIRRLRQAYRAGAAVTDIVQEAEDHLWHLVNDRVGQRHGRWLVVDDALDRLRDAMTAARHKDYDRMARDEASLRLLVKRRVIDAMRHARKGDPPEFAEPERGDDGFEIDWLDGIETINAFGDASNADVARLMLKIRDKRRVAAFRLYMHRPQYSFVAVQMGIDEKTARKWVSDVIARVRRELEL